MDKSHRENHPCHRRRFSKSDAFKSCCVNIPKTAGGSNQIYHWIRLFGFEDWVYDFENVTDGRFLLAKLEEIIEVDRNTMAIIWRGPDQGEL